MNQSAFSDYRHNARRLGPGAVWLATAMSCTGAAAQEVDLSDLASLAFHKTEGEWTSHRGSSGLRVTEPADGQNPDEDKLINDLKPAGQTGAVALWIGPGTVAHFRNLSITTE